MPGKDLTSIGARLRLGPVTTEPRAMGVRAAPPFGAWSGQQPGTGLGAGMAGWPWVEGKEENQLSGNCPAVGSGAHDTVFIESSLSLLIPRSGVNPFQAAVPAWGRRTGSEPGSAASSPEGGVVSGQAPVLSRRKCTSHLGSVGTGWGMGSDQPSAAFPQLAVLPARIWPAVRGGIRPTPCPAGGLRPWPQTAAAGPIRPLGRTGRPFRARGFLQPAPPPRLPGPPPTPVGRPRAVAALRCVPAPGRRRGAAR